MAVAIQMLVQAAEMTQAIAEMNRASETYKEAVEASKSAADELASKWEGAAKDQFVIHQKTAYDWHLKIIQVVKEMIDVARKAIELYTDMEDSVKSIMKG